LLREIVLLIKETFGYYQVTVGLIEGQEIVFKAGAKSDRLEVPFLPPPLKVGGRGITAWVAASGKPLLVPDVSQEPRYVFFPDASETQSELAVPLKTKTGILGVLNIESDRLDAFDESDVQILESLANQAAIAIENAWLYEQARRLAVVEERQRLARELHDSVTQALYGVTLYAEAAARQLTAQRVDLATNHLQELRETAQEALREMRLLIFELRPSVLESDGLVNALRSRLEAVEERAGLGIEFDVRGEVVMPSSVEEGLYRIAQEALNNALKHASAHNVSVRLNCDDDWVILEIVDDGIGFDSSAAVKGGGLGLDGMIERATRMGGEISLNSEPGAGTRVRVEVPR
ncbi:MAG: GAF domain-containing protein, partial [Anaerolineae bacterium]